MTQTPAGETVAAFIRAATEATGTPIDTFSMFAFGNRAEMANGLAALVASGQKRATAELMQSYEEELLPQVGALSVVLDGSGEPVALIRTMDVEVRPFEEVDAAFARDEGEGDGSLTYWRAAHRAYFERSGLAFDERALVVCERFEVIYPPAPQR